MLGALSNLCPMGSPNPGEAKKNDEIDGQVGMEDLLPTLDEVDGGEKK